MLGSRCRPRSFFHLFVLIACGSIVLMISFHYSQQKKPHVTMSTELHVINTMSQRGNTFPEPQPTGLTVGGQCKIPELDLNDPTLAKYFHFVAPLKCSSEKNWINIGPNFTFIIDSEAVKKHGDINCDYTYFWRKTDSEVNMETTSGFKNGSSLKGDYFRAECVAQDKEHYRNVHATIMPSQDAIKRARQAKINLKKDSPKQNLTGFNVYLFSFDSISRMSFMRKLPKTFKYVTEELGAITLQGYNIVGDGTPQAFIPIFTGKTEEELPLTRKRYKDSKYVDVYPMIWKEYEKAGYVTMFGEDDSPHSTAMFSYRLNGFEKQPTDHYTITWFDVAMKERKHHKSLCFGDEPEHVAFWRYGLEFLQNYPSDVGKLSILHSASLSHDNMNNVQAADDDMRNNIATMKQKGLLDNTILIVMADHGARFAEFRNTHQGQLEERLPMFSIILPEKFKKLYPQAVKNLKINANGRLVTPFDIHETLKRVIDWKEPRKLPLDFTRSLSVFDEIPEGRTCAHAHTEPHWCTCLGWETLPTTDIITVSVASDIVKALNMGSEKHRSLCAPLLLDRIEDAKRLVPSDSLLKYKTAKDKDGFVPDLTGTVTVAFAHYQITFRTTPGDGLFETTATYDSRTGKNRVTVNLKDVSRINKYGDAPHCILDKDIFLRKWCVCYDKVTNH